MARDSVGGVVECAVTGLSAGLGGPLFGGVESLFSSILFGIPAVKGVEFGEGFGAAALRGSQNNDPFTVAQGGACLLYTSQEFCFFLQIRRQSQNFWLTNRAKRGMIKTISRSEAPFGADAEQEFFP